jgi:hypothetical protein
MNIKASKLQYLFYLYLVLLCPLASLSSSSYKKANASTSLLQHASKSKKVKQLNKKRSFQIFGIALAGIAICFLLLVAKHKRRLAQNRSIKYQAQNL